MGSEDIEGFIKRLCGTHVASEADLRPCSEEDFAILRDVHIDLPLSYRHLMLTMGRGAGTFKQGTDFFFPDNMNLNADAAILLEENAEPFRLPEDVFVFSMHQGYEFNYFSLKQGDDPPVYQYIEGSGVPKMMWRSFTRFLENSLDSQI